MADILIKQFYVRYQGHRYGAGEIIYDMPDNMAKKLIAESQGTIEILPKRNHAKQFDDNNAISMNLDDVNMDALPPVLPETTVK